MKIWPMRHAGRPKHTAWALLSLLVAAMPLACAPCLASEMKLAETDSYTLTFEPYLRTDFNMMENNLDLDTDIRDDRVQYISFDYALAFDFRVKDNGPELYFMLERNAFYDYNTPVIIHNTLQTFNGKVHGYYNAELLPKVKEYWGDSPIAPGSDIRLRGGLFKYEVGHGISLNGSYQNYGLELYTEEHGFRWNVYTCWPDINNKQLLGPYIKQEKPQGVDWEHSKAYFISTDVKAQAGRISAQPYAGLLMDYSVGKRQSFFQTATDRDMLGTVGVSFDFDLGKFKLSAEWARNFGMASSISPGMPSVEHRGYAVYADAAYDMGRFMPIARFIFGSGNKLTTDMITNGDTLYPGSKNNAFSVFSPFNNYLVDSIYPSIPTLPLVAMGNGLAMNYGIPRPGSFRDPAQIENMVLVDLAFSYLPTDKIDIIFDWWYIANAQKGIGMYNNVPKVISPEIGTEVDLGIKYKIFKGVALKLVGGLFMPGAAYREERTDTGGSLFTPFVRGDGKADNAYQVEMSLETHF